jgi:hypothetical protein
VRQQIDVKLVIYHIKISDNKETLCGCPAEWERYCIGYPLADIEQTKFHSREGFKIDEENLCKDCLKEFSTLKIIDSLKT